VLFGIFIQVLKDLVKFFMFLSSKWATYFWLLIDFFILKLIQRTYNQTKVYFCKKKKTKVYFGCFVGALLIVVVDFRTVKVNLIWVKVGDNGFVCVGENLWIKIKFYLFV
jgi:hypothetical protein